MCRTGDREASLEEEIKTNAYFLELDRDGDGCIDKKEFRKSIAALGYDCPKEDIDGLFDTFDEDGGGTID